jgi:DNA-binding CsgD family transcriptional regulator
MIEALLRSGPRTARPVHVLSGGVRLVAVDIVTLVGLGIDEDAARLWQTMHACPGAGVEELAAVLGLTEGETRRRLDLLADLALVRASMDLPGLLVPIAPQAGVELLLRQQELELAENHRRLQARRDEITAGIAERISAPSASSSGGAEYLVGRDAIQARFEELAYSMRESADSMLPGASFSVPMLEAARPLDTEALRRGIRLRSLYQESIRNDFATLAYARDMASLGATVRTAPVLGQRLWIGDARVAMVPMDPADSQRGYACITEPGVVASLRELFDGAWRNAAPLDVGNPVQSVTGLSDTERELLTMLADGMTDEAAAKRLGVSLRTVRRIMADLMVRLEAGSRFEAGIKAAKKGWL